MSSGAATLPARHLLSLSVLAVAQPLFDILARHIQFFVTSNSSSQDVLGLVLVACLLPALVLITLQRLALVLGPRCGMVVAHLIAILLFGLIAARLLNQLNVGDLGLFIALVTLLAVALSHAYRRWPLVGSFVDFLLLAVLVVPAVFIYQVLVASPLAGLNQAAAADRVEIANPVPVFFIVIDEVPVTSLQRADGSLDRERYPNFARLADQSSWYRNATTVADSTEVAIPALLTGLRPDPGWTNPTASASRHPRNLFTALAGHYQINAYEPVTALCPPAICASSRRQTDSARDRFTRLVTDSAVVYAHLVSPPALRKQLPSIDQYWSGFFHKASDSQLKAAAASPRQQLLDSLAAVSRQSLNFVHIYLPHVPWRYLPSGHVYASHPRDYRVEGFDPSAPVNLWLDDERAIALAYQRHLLQLAYVDRYLGELLDTIQARGWWDDALFVLVADHGLSFRPGQPRRWVGDNNLADIASVPLFVKYPGQVQGRIDDANVESVDVLPTVFQALGVETDWRFDGLPLQDSEQLAQRLQKQLLVKQREDGVAFVEMQLPADFQRDSPTLAFRERILGGTAPGRDRFDISTDPELLGVVVDQAILAEPAGTVYVRSLDTLRRFQRPRNRLVPAHVRGRIVGDVDPELAIAVALNGRIAAVTRSFSSGEPGRFAVILPEQAFADANNELGIYQVLQTQPLRLAPLKLQLEPGS